MSIPAPSLTADPDKTIADYTEKIRLLPRRISGRGIEKKWHLKLRVLYRERGRLYEAKGDYDEAIEDYSEVIKTFIQGRGDFWSDLLCDYFSRARCYLFRGDFDGAIADFTAMIELHPTCFLAGFNRGLVACYKIRGETHGKKGDYESAIKDLTEAIRLDPQDVCSVPCPREYLSPHRTAFDPEKVGWKRSRALAILSAVYAKSGNFDQARQYQRRLLELSDLTEEEAAGARMCLALYDDKANREAV